MFLPMSWTSPLTVAITILPSARAPLACFSASRKGVRYATDFFMTRALLTTWGRNILPEPNRSPTTLMPDISGPSITSSGRPYFCRASSVSVSTNSSIPRTSACDSRSSTVPFRQASSATGPFSCSFTVCAKAMSRSVASGRRFSSTSSTRSRRSFGISW